MERERGNNQVQHSLIGVAFTAVIRMRALRFSHVWRPGDWRTADVAAPPFRNARGTLAPLPSSHACSKIIAGCISAPD
jgi:hypothetical protein